MDRFYSSPAVFDFFWARKTKAVHRYMHAKSKRTATSKCCVKKLRIDECGLMRSFAVFEMEGY